MEFSVSPVMILEVFNVYLKHILLPLNTSKWVRPQVLSTLWTFSWLGLPHYGEFNGQNIKYRYQTVARTEKHRPSSDGSVEIVLSEGTLFANI